MEKPGIKPKTTRDLPAGWRRRILKMAKHGMTEQHIRQELGLNG